MNSYTKKFRYQSQRGLTLVELMISVVIGLVIIAGLWTLLNNSRSSGDHSISQAEMLDSGRYALHILGHDIRHAGVFGRNSTPSTIGPRPSSVQPINMPVAAIGDCSPGFYANIDQKIFVSDDENPFIGTCLPSSNYKSGTDILVVRYADPFRSIPTVAAVADNTLLTAHTAYVEVGIDRGQIFIGSVPPDLYPNIHRLITNVYYVNPNTVAGDGIPSLRKISLTTGAGNAPEMEDQLVLSGVYDLQVQLGLVDCNEEEKCADITSISRYVDADTDIFGDWGDTADPVNRGDELMQVNNIRAIKVWVQVLSNKIDLEIDNSSTFFVGSKQINWPIDPTDRRRSQVFSSVFSMRAVSGG